MNPENTDPEDSIPDKTKSADSNTAGMDSDSPSPDVVSSAATPGTDAGSDTSGPDTSGPDVVSSAATPETDAGSDTSDPDMVSSADSSEAETVPEAGPSEELPESGQATPSQNHLEETSSGQETSGPASSPEKFMQNADNSGGNSDFSGSERKSGKQYSKSENPYMNTRSSYPEVPAKKKRNHLSYVALVFALLLIIGFSIVAIFYGFGFEGDLGTSDKVAVIYVQGTMLSGNIPSGFGYATSEEISENIRRAVEDEQVKAIVLRINSGGGSPAAAQEIVGEIRKAQAEGVPVVISMGDVAASAAYYISAPADYIMANPSTTTGSIGVIWVFQNRSALYEDEGVEFYVAKSGEFKDMGGTWRGLTEDEKEYADRVILENYEDFVTSVANGRNLSRGEVKSLADGRVYTGVRAKELGLIDDFGNLYDAVDKAAKLAGIEEEPRVVYMNRASLSRLLLGSEELGARQSVSQLVSYYEESPYGKISA